MPARCQIKMNFFLFNLISAPVVSWGAARVPTLLHNPPVPPKGGSIMSTNLFLFIGIMILILVYSLLFVISWYSLDFKKERSYS